MAEIVVLHWPVPFSERITWLRWLPLLLVMGSDEFFFPALRLIDVLTSVTLFLGEPVD